MKPKAFPQVIDHIRTDGAGRTRTARGRGICQIAGGVNLGAEMAREAQTDEQTRDDAQTASPLGWQRAG